MSKERFKIFAGNHPEFVDYVMNGETTWQKLYELFDIYGESSNVWSRYTTKTSSMTDVTFKDVFNNLKNIDMDSFQKGIENLQKTIGLLQGMSLGNPVNEKPYIPREIYHHMED